MGKLVCGTGVEHELEGKHPRRAPAEDSSREKTCSVHVLVLLYCGVSRANFFIRAVSPDNSLHFAQRHEEQIWRCLTTLIGVVPEAISRRDVAVVFRRSAA